VRDTPPSAQDYSRYRTSGIPKETRIPVTGEKLGVSRAREATNTKEPVSEKNTQVSTQRERRPACKTSSTKDIYSLLRQNSIDLVGKTLRTNDNQDGVAVISKIDGHAYLTITDNGDDVSTKVSQDLVAYEQLCECGPCHSTRIFTLQTGISFHTIR
jgi:hypothetical protein